MYRMIKTNGKPAGIEVETLQEAIAFGTKKGWAWEEIKEEPKKQLSALDKEMECYKEAQRLFKIAFHKFYSYSWVSKILVNNFGKDLAESVLKRSELEFSSILSNGYATYFDR